MYTRARIGVRPVPWLPTAADCAATVTTYNRKTKSEREIWRSGVSMYRNFRLPDVSMSKFNKVDQNTPGTGPKHKEPLKHLVPWYFGHSNVKYMHCIRHDSAKTARYVLINIFMSAIKSLQSPVQWEKTNSEREIWRSGMFLPSIPTTWRKYVKVQ